MIRFSKENKRYFPKRSSNWITIVGTETIVIRASSSYSIDTGLKFWFDGGTVALLMEASLPPVLRIVNKSLQTKSKLIIEIYNISDKDVVLNAPIEICYLIPLATAYYNNIEMKEVNDAWFGVGDNLAEI